MRGLVAELGGRGLRVDYRSVWEFVHAEQGRSRRHGQSRSHKAKAVRRAIRHAGARLLFLPKYSPDLNPIEQLFAKLKHQLRRDQPRAPDTICTALAAALNTLTAPECSYSFALAGDH